MSGNQMEDRKARVKQLFRLSGDAFIEAVKREFRSNKKAFNDDFRTRNGMRDIVVNDHLCHIFRASDQVCAGHAKKLLYIHGGGFVCEAGPQQYWFCEYISRQTGVEIWFPEYPLAPEHAGTEALEMLLRVYEMMLEDTQADSIVIMGDSAGGALSLSLAMALREAGKPQPKNVIMISPAVELDTVPAPEEEEYYKKLTETDDLVSPNSMPAIAECWRGTLPLTDYRVNPIHGDLKGLAPLTLFSGTGEVLNLASRHFLKEAEKQGVDVEYIEKEGAPHIWFVFPDYSGEDERNRIIERIRT